MKYTLYSNLDTSHINRFLQLFPTEESCIEEICQRIENSLPEQFCNHCRSSKVIRRYGSRRVECLSCKKWFHITTNTFFERMRKSKAWMASIWLIEQGIQPNASQISRLGNATVSACWAILKRLGFLLNKHLNKYAKAGLELAHSSSFLNLFIRRSRETPAKKHPSEEQFEFEKTLTLLQHEDETINEDEINFIRDIKNESCNQPENKELKTTTNETAKPQVAMSQNESESIENAILAILSDKPIHIENIITCISKIDTAKESSVLSALTMLELQGSISRNPGEMYSIKASTEKACTSNYFKVTGSNCHFVSENLIDDAISQIRLSVRGISRKYLQLFLAIYWCSSNRKIWKSGALLEYCCVEKPIKFSDIYDFNTPLLVGMNIKK